MDEKIWWAKNKREEQRKKMHHELMGRMARWKEQYNEQMKEILSKWHKENRKTEEVLWSNRMKWLTRMYEDTEADAGVINVSGAMNEEDLVALTKDETWKQEA